MGSEISPLLAMEEARSVGAIVALSGLRQSRPSRSVSAPATRSRRARSASAAQEPRPVVEPDLVLVPLIAIDGRGTRLGRGKGHYDRALARLKKSGARLVGVGWSLQRLADSNSRRRLGHAAGRFRLARRNRAWSRSARSW